MSYTGARQLTILFTCGPEAVSEGDALFEKHSAWIKRSHHRDGEKALLEYHVSKSAELENPLDPSSGRTGNTTFALTEIYAKRAGLDDHWRQAMVLWDDFEDFASFARKCRITTVHGGEIVQHLW